MGQDFKSHKPLLCQSALILPSDSAVWHTRGSPPCFTPEQVEFFEPFWDSGEPRAGEKGARGWRAWMHQQERGGWVVISPGKAPHARRPFSSGICFYISWLFVYMCKPFISSLRTVYKHQTVKSTLRRCPGRRDCFFPLESLKQSTPIPSVCNALRVSVFYQRKYIFQFFFYGLLLK